tara:strand:+ start:833 stop:1201 length:369 start_codon:yes stop_codon:yes gene_type:complete
MVWAYALVGGILLGGGGASAFFLTRKPEPAPTPAVIEQIEVQKNLTEPDILEVPCSSEFIKENGADLCRELFCRMTTRGIDSKTSGGECEEISNLINSKAILTSCISKPDPDGCFDLFFRRK